ncbi:MAG TPA: hypothetical protein VHE23_03130 [Candidatus Acidoferrales bacterium]|nr:hypothetical protein [Candidatus Acidoferrales bacterium]
MRCEAIPSPSARRPRFSRGAPFLIICSAVFLGNGCAGRKPAAFPWQTASMVRPRPPAKPASTAVEPAPDLEPVIPRPPRLILAHNAPPRPRTNGSAGTDEADPDSRAGSFSIAPQLTPAESAAAQQQTDQNLRAAEANLSRSKGRALSPTQSDLAQKSRSFLRQARKAAREGDWVRARNLAVKAQLLSEELVRTL